jgi:3-hydroxybutyryl-CoA dehydrogenase
MTLSRDTPVAIVGAGLMGLAIGQVFAARGHDVTLYDLNNEMLASALERAGTIFDLLEQDKDAGLAHLKTEGDLAKAVAGAGLVIEAGPERLAVKREIFLELERLTDASVVLATNTSSIPIREIVEPLDQKFRVLGTHFWNPPYLVPLVEVVEAEATSPELVTETIDLLRSVGLRPVRLRADIPGFIGNRMQHALKREAIAIVASGVCDAETVDTVVKYGFGLRLPVLGPLEQTDLVGLELTLAIHETLMPALDVTPEAHPLLVQLVAEGKTGAKKGEGFRKWTPEEAGELQRRVNEYLVSAAKQRRLEEETEGSGRSGS